MTPTFRHGVRVIIEAIKEFVRSLRGKSAP